LRSSCRWSWWICSPVCSKCHTTSKGESNTCYLICYSYYNIIVCGCLQDRSPSIITIPSNGIQYNDLRIPFICNIIFFAISACCRDIQRVEELYGNVDSGNSSSENESSMESDSIPEEILWKRREKGLPQPT